MKDFIVEYAYVSKKGMLIYGKGGI